MKVAIVIDDLSRGGAERQALYSARELARAGCTVEVIYYSHAAHGYDLAADELERMTYIPKNNHMFRFLWRLRRHLKRSGVDIVHAYKSTPCVYGCLAAAWAGVPLVFAGFREQYRSRGLLRIAHKLVDRCATAWITNSRAIADSLIRDLGIEPSRCHIVYNGVDRQIFVSGLTPQDAKRRIGLQSHAPVISIIGRLRPDKNHAMFLDMASRVLGARPDARFLVIGDGPREHELRMRAASLGIESQVLFLGARSEIADLLAATDVCVITSPREGLANSLVEAMSVGIPVISTEYPGVEEVIEDRCEGFVVPFGDVEAMVAAAVKLLDDEALRKRMGKKGIERVERQFSLKAMTENLLSVYRRFLDRT